MNVQHVKQKLDKVNSFFTYLVENQEVVSHLDRDVFLASIRALYDACFENASILPPTETAPKQEPKTTETNKKRPKLVFNHQNTNKTIPKKEKITPQQPSVVQEVTKEVVEPSNPAVDFTPKEVVSSIPSMQEVSTPDVSPKIESTDPTETPQQKPPQEETFQAIYEPLFHYKAATDLSQKLSTSKLDNLQKALGLNEKFLYINELFGGDVGQFQNAIKILNEGESFDAARHYMEQHLIDQNKWMDKPKKAVAKDFIKLVRRRYV